MLVILMYSLHKKRYKPKQKINNHFNAFFFEIKITHFVVFFDIQASEYSFITPSTLHHVIWRIVR